MSELPSCLLSLRVVPNASRGEVVGYQADGRLKVKVAAPPEGGRANKAVCELLAEALDLPKRAVTVERGETSREKTVRIAGMDEAAVTVKLGR
jgi:uncharacterized protein (TIGR00251 family)